MQLSYPVDCELARVGAHTKLTEADGGCSCPYALAYFAQPAMRAKLMTRQFPPVTPAVRIAYLRAGWSCIRDWFQVLLPIYEQNCVLVLPRVQRIPWPTSRWNVYMIELGAPLEGNRQ